MTRRAANEARTKLRFLVLVPDNVAANQIRSIADGTEVGVNPVVPRYRVCIGCKQHRILGGKGGRAVHSQAARGANMRMFGSEPGFYKMQRKLPQLPCNLLHDRRGIIVAII